MGGRDNVRMWGGEGVCGRGKLPRRSARLNLLCVSPNGL
ncbi:MAG: hypothetical protein BWY63_02478 [Chloroflexi bacterium ADurb.Bin360]|nr:MAG: hypothetical protein BWY63_02478 [Chloroflexi bacterium ADurb.Bin360]